MTEVAAHIEKFITHPLLWGVATVLAIALALGGRFSVTAATWLIWLAWGVAVFGLYRTFVYFGLEIVIRLLALASVAFALSIGAVLLNRWLRGPQASLAPPPPVANPEPPRSIEPTAQRALILNLQAKYEDSVVTVRSIKIDNAGNSLGYVDDTGFFVNDRGLILTTAENLRLPNENRRRKFEVISSNGMTREVYGIGSTASKYWRLLKVDSRSKPLPLSHEPFIPGQTLIILGKSAHSGALESRLGKIDHDEDPFSLAAETPAGFNGSPIFDEGGKVVAVQIFRPETGQHGLLMCLRVPTKKLLEGMAAHSE